MTNLHIVERQVGAVIILDMNGELRIGGSIVTLPRIVRRLLEESHTQVILNLAGVNQVDSSGLGELVATYAALKLRGGHVKLLHLTHRVRELMEITKLQTIFEIYENETEAVGSFKIPPTKSDGHVPVGVKRVRHETHP